MSEHDFEYNEEQELEQWFQDVENHKEVLISIIKEFHPSRKKKSDLKITAPNAELACEKLRSQIKKNTKEDVLISFESALKERDERIILKILNDVWFGVPESTSCWKIPGFKELVELIEEAP